MNDTSKAPQQQEWTSTGSVIGNIAINIKSPVHIIIGEGGSIDMPVAEVSIVDKDYILRDLIIDNADFSTVLVAAYQAVVLGKRLASRIKRDEARVALAAAMRIINRAGAGKVISDTRDNGVFEFAGKFINWERVVSATIVSTDYTTVTLKSEDGKLQQGTWTRLETTVDTVQSAEEQYADYAKAFVGE